MSNFCMKCGTKLIEGECPNCIQSEEKKTDKYEEKYKQFFMSPKEKLVAVLGNSYLEKFFYNGTIRKGFSVVSDKRVYFQGTNYYISYNANGRKNIIKNKQSRTVDLKDITGTGTDSYLNKIWLIMGCIFLLFAFLGLTSTNPTVPIIIGVSVFAINLLQYFRSSVTLVTIQYAGGVIGFDVNWFSEQEIEMFQKQLRLAKDKAIEASDNAIANKFQEAVNGIGQPVTSLSSKADEITKLVDLLQKGIITQDEFEKMKKDLI